MRVYAFLRECQITPSCDKPPSDLRESKAQPHDNPCCRCVAEPRRFIQQKALFGKYPSITFAGPFEPARWFNPKNICSKMKLLFAIGSKMKPSVHSRESEIIQFSCPKDDRCRMTS